MRWDEVDLLWRKDVLGTRLKRCTVKNIWSFDSFYEVSLIIKENTIFEDHLVSEELNKFFENVTRGVEINQNSYIIDTDSNEINSVEKVINKYRNHPSILLIKIMLKDIPSFSFNKVGLSEIERELNLINPTKATTLNCIPPKLLNSTKTICSETFKTIFNNC